MGVPESKRRTRRIVLRVSPQVAVWVRAQAAREGVTISVWVVNRLQQGPVRAGGGDE